MNKYSFFLIWSESEFQDLQDFRLAGKTALRGLVFRTSHKALADNVINKALRIAAIVRLASSARCAGIGSQGAMLLHVLYMYLSAFSAW